MTTRTYTPNEILDLELKYKDNHEVMELIAFVKGYTHHASPWCLTDPDADEGDDTDA